MDLNATITRQEVLDEIHDSRVHDTVTPALHEADLAVARDVLLTEAAGLTALARSLGSGFEAAIGMLHRTKGRVVVTGIGKSGHVARKIAATLASTGTPAFFVHPVEASHGDLGMVIEGDALLALSNSGESSELADIIAHASRFALPIIAITSRAESALARAAAIALILPAAPEAGPIGLAPTTSTTMQMALGDAIALALLARRGFSASDFSNIHPGGRLGTRLKHVAELMHTGEELPLAPPDVTMDRAILLMTAKHFGCLGIVDENGFLMGLITDGDLRRAMAADLLTRMAGEVMTCTPRVIGPDALAEEALRQMTMPQPKVTSLFVVDKARRVVGIIHIHDLLRAGIA
jgi:arabinose-5-phosphate isomerase